MPDSRSAFGWRWTNLTDANVTNGADTVILANAGLLHTITCNSIPTVSGNLLVYDGPSAGGLLIASIEMIWGGIATPSFPSTLIFDCILSTGLTVTCDATLANFDFTITYM